MKITHNQIPPELTLTIRTRYLSELPKGVQNRRQKPHKRYSSNLSLNSTSRQHKERSKRRRTTQMISGVLENGEEEEEGSVQMILRCREIKKKKKKKKNIQGIFES